jgi:hypothetical protein
MDMASAPMINVVMSLISLGLTVWFVVFTVVVIKRLGIIIDLLGKK